MTSKESPTQQSHLAPDMKIFNQALVESIDEAISQLLSRGAVEALHYYLERNHELKIEDIPYHLDILVSILKEVFGGGGKTIQNAIARRFYSKMQLEFVRIPNHSLIDYVEDAKRRIEVEGR